MVNQKIEDKLLNRQSGNLFYSFFNASGKRWLMPVKNMQIAMGLYQPSGKAGRLVKALFPKLHGLPFVRKVIHAQQIRCDLDESLKRLLCKLFQIGEEELEFAMFMGTPCVHRKITIQINKGQQILGYCKVTDNSEVAALFNHEANVLGQFKQGGICGVPVCLYHGLGDGGYWLFVQSTTKSKESKVLHEWSEVHEEFLAHLHRKTCRQILFEESDYHHMLQDLLQHMDWLPDWIDRRLIKQAIEGVYEEWQRTSVEFSAYHADFTPWNTFVERGRLFVFDWEYARMTYPPMLDRYHFFTQTAIFERHWDVGDIISYLQSEQSKWVETRSYMLYLLDVITRFTLREKGNPQSDILHSLAVWYNLLKYLTE